MLSIYRQLFDELRRESLAYLVYKGVEHLQDDLDGARGDVDLLVAKKDIDRFDSLVRSLGFIRHADPATRPRYYFAIDLETGKTAKLDVDWNIKIGVRPFVTRYLPVEVERLQFSLWRGAVKVIASVDYLPLFFLLKVTSNRRRADHLLYLKALCEQGLEWSRGRYSGQLLRKAGVEVEQLAAKIRAANSWNDFSYEQQQLFGSASIDPKRLWLQRLQLFRRIGKRLSSALGCVPERIRRQGKFVVVSGHDSSQVGGVVEYLSSIEYFKYTGVKCIAAGESAISRLLQQLFVNYYMHLGNLVLMPDCSQAAFEGAEGLNKAGGGFCKVARHAHLKILLSNKNESKVVDGWVAVNTSRPLDIYRIEIIAKLVELDAVPERVGFETSGRREQ